jgi:hypothetical protein
VGLTAALPLPQAGLHEPASERLGADVQVHLGEFLAGEGGAEVGEVQPIGEKDLSLEFGVRLVVGWPAAQGVDNGGVTTSLEFALEAADLADGQFEQSGCLGLGAFAHQDRLQDLEDIAFSLTHGDPVGALHVDRHGSSLA